MTALRNILLLLFVVGIWAQDTTLAEKEALQALLESKPPPSMVNANCSLNFEVIRTLPREPIEKLQIHRHSKMVAKDNNCFRKMTPGLALIFHRDLDVIGVLLPAQVAELALAIANDAELKLLPVFKAIQQKLFPAHPFAMKVCESLKTQQDCTIMMQSRCAIAYLKDAFPGGCVREFTCRATTEAEVACVSEPERQEFNRETPADGIASVQTREMSPTDMDAADVETLAATNSKTDMRAIMAEMLQNRRVKRLLARAARVEERGTAEPTERDMERAASTPPDATTIALVKNSRPLAEATAEEKKTMVKDAVTASLLTFTEFAAMTPEEKCPVEEGCPFADHIKSVKKRLCRGCAGFWTPAQMPQCCREERKVEENAMDVASASAADKPALVKDIIQNVQESDDNRRKLCESLDVQTNYMSSLSALEINEFGRCLVYQDIPVASLTTTEQIIAYCGVMAASHHIVAGRAEKAAFCESKGFLKSDMGTLAASLTLEKISAMTADDARAVLRSVCKHAQDPLIKRAVWAVIAATSITAQDIADLGMCICDLDDTARAAVTSHAEARTQIRTIMERVTEDSDNMVKYGAEDTLKTCKEMVGPPLVTNLLSSAASAGRRKRQTQPSALTCQDLQQAGLDAVTVQHIETMVYDELLLCQSFIQDETDMIKLQTYATIFKSGDNTALDTYNVTKKETVKCIMWGFTAQELVTIPLAMTDLTLLAGCPLQHPDNTKREAAWGNVKTRAQIMPDAITADQLNSLGSMVCGMPASDLTQIPAQNVMDSLTIVSAQTCFEFSQVTALMENQTCPTDSKVGVGISGFGMLFAGCAVSAVAAADIPDIKAEALALMQLSDFTYEQISMFTNPQATAIPLSQTSTADAMTQECINQRKAQQECTVQTTAAPAAPAATTTTAAPDRPAATTTTAATAATKASSTNTSTTASTATATGNTTTTTTTAKTTASDTGGTGGTVTNMDPCAWPIAVDSLTEQNIMTHAHILEKGCISLLDSLSTTQKQSKEFVKQLLMRYKFLPENMKHALCKPACNNLDEAAKQELKTLAPCLVSCLEELSYESAISFSPSNLGDGLDAAVAVVKTELTSVATNDITKLAEAVQSANEYIGELDRATTEDIFGKLKENGNMDALQTTKLRRNQGRMVAQLLEEQVTNDLKLLEGETKVPKERLMTAMQKVPECARAELSSTIIHNLDNSAKFEAYMLTKASAQMCSMGGRRSVRKKPSSPVVRAAVKGLRESGGLADLSKENLGEVLEEVMAEDFATLAKDKICSLDLLQKISYGNFEAEKATVLVEQCKATWGMTKTLEYLPQGLTLPDISGLEASANTPDQVENLCAKVQHLDSAKFAALCALITKRVTDTPADLEDRDIMEKYSCVVAHCTELADKIAKDDKPKFWENVAENTDVMPLTVAEQQMLIKNATNTTSIGKLLEGHGGPSFACSMTLETYTSLPMDCDMVLANISEFAGCMSNTDVAEKVWACVKGKDGYALSKLSQDELTLMDVMPAEDRNAIPDASLCNMLGDYVDDVQSKMHWLDKREDMRYMGDRAKFPRYDLSTGHTAALTRCRTAQNSATCQPASASSGSSAGRRRKRATAALTCEDVERERDLLSTRPAADLSTMTDAEFAECVDVIGELRLPDTHCIKFIEKAKKAYGTVDTWTDSQLNDLGGLVSCLTKDELGTIAEDVLSYDAMNRVGALGDWSVAEKATVVADHYVMHTLKGADKMTASDLLNMGDVAGGLKEAHIKAFPKEVYCGSSSIVGKLPNVEESEQVAWSSFLKECKGEVGTWTAGDIKTIGHIIGGMNETDLNKLTKAQIQEISAASFEQMSAKSFAKLTPAQLAFLSQTQTRALTTAQINSLSEEQRSSLSHLNTVMDQENGGESAAGFVEASLFLIVTTVTAAFCRI